jgi:translocation and assembly module TamB
MLRRLFLSSLLLIAAITASIFWFAHSERGLQLIAQWASQTAAGNLQLGNISGTLTGPLAIEKIVWDSPDLKLTINKLHLDWRPGALLQNKVQISELTAESVQLSVTSTSQATPPPATLRLPVAVDIEKLAISVFDYAALFSASDLRGRLLSDGETHQLRDFHAKNGLLSVTGEASLGGSAPLPLIASAQLSGQLQERPLRLALQAAGPLNEILLKARAEQGISGHANATLTPFAEQSVARAHVELDAIDPAAWQPGAPRADLALNLDLRPHKAGLTGEFSLSNRLPGYLDRQRLPLERFSGTLDSQGETLKLGKLQAVISGGGTLNGDAHWAKDTLTLDLQAARVDAARLVSSLRPTRLAGPVLATITAEKQSLQLKLTEPRFTTKAEVVHAADTISVPLLELTAGDSRLKASGELSLNKAKGFRIAGELTRFDPSRFMKTPAALINSQFTGQGQLAPRPLLDAKFEITDSRFAGQPLSGRGDFRLDWPRIPRADVTLNAGVNHLLLKGAYGQTGDLLDIRLEAPDLAPYGIDGDLSAQARLGGHPQAATLSAQATTKRLRLPGVGQLSALSLNAEGGNSAGSPLHVDLTVARLDRPEQVAAAKLLRLQIDGSNSSHQLRASGDLGDKQKFSILLDGGLSAGQWQGSARQATLSGGRQNLKLAAPSALALAPDAWSFGPAEISGDDGENRWRGKLQAAADAHLLRASLEGRGPRLGEVTAQMEAGMHDAWSINPQAPWQASIRSNIADLGWVADLLGDEWKSAGRFSGELNITGTPAQPLSSGQFQGKDLVLHLPEQGLHLARGELDIEVAANLLRVKKLAFDSLLHAVPRPLRRSERGPEISALAARPGRLEIGGEMRVDRDKLGDNAFLDIRFERLGAFQLPDQWVVISGDGRLTWQDGTLGLRGKLATDAGYWQLANTGTPQLSDDVVVKRPGNEKPASALRPKLDLDLSADLGRNFQFTGAGLSSRLVGDIRLRASGRDLPRATGNIRTRDGRFEAYGQQLSIERGILTFQGLLDNPALDVRAVRKGLAVEAGVQVSGTAQKPIIKLISEPELPDPEKLAWLILGHGPELMSAGDATVLLSAAGSILGSNSGGVVQQLKKGFGIDEFGVRSGQIGDTGSRSQSSRVAGSSVDTTAATGNQILSIGKRLSSNAMLSYEQTLGKAESIVKLTVNLTRQISLIGRAGSDNALDVFYIITLGDPRERGRRTSATRENE